MSLKVFMWYTMDGNVLLGGYYEDKEAPDDCFSDYYIGSGYFIPKYWNHAVKGSGSADAAIISCFRGYGTDYFKSNADFK